MIARLLPVDCTSGSGARFKAAGRHQRVTAMNQLLVAASIFLLALVGLPTAAAAAGNATVQAPEAVGAVTVDLPEFPTLSHASPSTWHTLPPPPASRFGLNGQHAVILFAWSNERMAAGRPTLLQDR